MTDRSQAFFLNTMERAAQATIAVTLDSCAGDATKPRAPGGAMTARTWTDRDGREWRVVVTIDVQDASR